ncbi:MAG: PadR family transcriptional regulator [Candidatus Ranarchaeia archaeon]
MSDNQEVEIEKKAIRRLYAKLTRETLWIYILRLLQEKSMYGYEIRTYIIDRFNFAPATVTSYVVLHKLTREGLVNFSWVKSPIGKPDRKYYEITKSGTEMMKSAKDFLSNIITTVFDKTN